MLSKIFADRLQALPVGHIIPVNKYYFRTQTYMEIRQYLKRVYKGEFVLFAENKREYILKRVKHEATANTEKAHDKDWRFYICKRPVRNGKVAGGGPQ